MLLFDNRVMSYLHESLKHCHEQRVSVYYYVLNFSIVFIFVVFAAVYLYCSLTTKRTPEEIYMKNVQDKEYVLHQIQRYKTEQNKLDSLSQVPIREKKRGEEAVEFRPTFF